MSVRRGVLWVPDWPIVAAVSEGELPAHLPSALCAGSVVVAVSAQARRCGVRPGMSRRTAQSLIPELVIGRVDEGQQVRAFEPVLRAIEGEVADVSVLRPGLAAMGISGAARYHGGEERVAELLIGAAAETGVEAQVGAGVGVLTAILAARHGVIVPSEKAVSFLHGHPTRALSHAATTPQMREEYSRLIGVWERLGLTTLGQVASLRRADVANRFGSVGVQAYRLAQGEDSYVGDTGRAAADLHVGRELDPPAASLDEISFVVQELSERLHDGLARHGLACESLRVVARDEGGQEHNRSWRIDGVPSASELAVRVRWQLSGWLEGRSEQPPSGPVARIDLHAEGNYAAGLAGHGLWGEASRGETEASSAAVRVQSLLGADAVRTPIMQGGRSPSERIRYVAWGDEAKPERDPAHAWSGQLPEPYPTTVMDPPVPIELVGHGRAVRPTPRGGLTAPPESAVIKSTDYAVLQWAGPWPVNGRWWDGQEPRVYVQLVTAQGAWLAVGSASGWGIEGVYD